jgi:hypothetical protein
MHPFAPSQAPKRVAESQNGARSRFSASSRLHKRFSQGTPLISPGVPCEIRLYSRLLAENLERAPFWGYCTILWVHVTAARARAHAAAASRAQ